MADLGLVALILVFFLLTRAYVAGCARLMDAAPVATDEPERQR